MHLNQTQIDTLRSLAREAEISAVIAADAITLESKTHILHIHDLDLTRTQLGITGYLKAVEKLSTQGKRNNRIENSGLEDCEFIETCLVRSNPEKRFDCDFNIISLVKTNGRNIKTILQDFNHTYVFVGNHFNEVIEALAEAPSRHLKRHYPEIFNFLISIETEVANEA